MENIGLIAAMPLESKALHQEIKGWRRSRFGKYQGARFRMLDRDCFLITSGIGCRRAMDATSALLDATNPQLLISFGIAGAMQKDLSIGDVIIAQQTCMFEKGHLVEFRPLAGLTRTCWDATENILQQVKATLCLGTAITTRASQLNLDMMDQVSIPILEMETSGIAQIAGKNSIPLLSVRAISDGPLAPLPFILENLYDEKDDLRLVKLIRMMLKQPRTLLKSFHVLRNSQIAANHAAKAVIAILNVPSPLISESRE
jgi:adenosylhomocysteine nucleosidase